jgi:hypothetical protein
MSAIANIFVFVPTPLWKIREHRARIIGTKWGLAKLRYIFIFDMFDAITVQLAILSAKSDQSSKDNMEQEA